MAAGGATAGGVGVKEEEGKARLFPPAGNGAPPTRHPHLVFHRGTQKKNPVSVSLCFMP